MKPKPRSSRCCYRKMRFSESGQQCTCFPGIFRGALDARATDITEEMKIAAVKAIADIIKPEELTEDYIIPGAFDERVADNVAREVAKTAIETGVSKLKKAE